MGGGGTGEGWDKCKSASAKHASPRHFREGFFLSPKYKVDGNKDDLSRKAPTSTGKVSTSYKLVQQLHSRPDLGDSEWRRQCRPELEVCIWAWCFWGVEGDDTTKCQMVPVVSAVSQCLTYLGATTSHSQLPGPPCFGHCRSCPGPATGASALCLSQLSLAVCQSIAAAKESYAVARGLESFHYPGKGNRVSTLGCM